MERRGRQRCRATCRNASQISTGRQKAQSACHRQLHGLRATDVCRPVTTPRSRQSYSGRLTGSAKFQRNPAHQLRSSTSRRHRLSRPSQHRHSTDSSRLFPRLGIVPRFAADLGDPHESSFLANYPSSIFGDVMPWGVEGGVSRWGQSADNVAGRTRRGLPEIGQSRAISGTTKKSVNH
jgi:hypothetical protein